MTAPLRNLPQPSEVISPMPANDAAYNPALQTGSLLRFITCGSVDDGKSTLIGRVLYEAGAVLDDQMDALDRDSQKFGTTGAAPDFALLVDGLSAEREQRITIDVAYRYFATEKRAFIVADTPGHEQYTRNMATGASTADLAVILVDARKGLLPQTRRHAYIVSLVGVRHIVVAINKMDLVGYEAGVFEQIERDFLAMAGDLGFVSITCIPVSARGGDNVVKRSEKMGWYNGPALLPFLERIEPSELSGTDSGFAFPVQWVNRPSLDFRGYAGTIAMGTIKAGDAVMALPSRTRTRIARIVTSEGDLASASAGQAVTLTTTEEIDLSRGDLLVSEASEVLVRNGAAVRLLTTANRTLAEGDQFLVKLGTATAQATIAEIRHAIDIETFDARPAKALGLNAIGLATLRFDQPLSFTSYRTNRELGSLILIDRITNETAAFGVLDEAAAPVAQPVPDSLHNRLRRIEERWLGRAGTEKRQDRVTRLSWRLSSSVLPGVLVYLASGSPVWGLGAMLVDAGARSLLRHRHDRAWRRARAKAPGTLENGGGI